MPRPRKNVRRCCLVLAVVAAIALPAASWLSQASAGDRDAASWVDSQSGEGAVGSTA